MHGPRSLEFDPPTKNRKFAMISRRSILITLGFVLICLGYFPWASMYRGVRNELQLIQGAAEADGVLISTENADFRDRASRVYWNKEKFGFYAFATPDGRTFTARKHYTEDTMQEHRAVEYLPDQPSVCRIKGDGCQNFQQWLCISAAGNLLLLVVMVLPGVFVVRMGLTSPRSVHAAAGEFD